jgi:hypothetical protein
MMSDLNPTPVRPTAIPPGTETCGCCDGIAPATPLAVDNRLGLSAIAYRIGRYADFRESLHANLSSARFAPLAKLLTRDDDDFTLGLIDAFACAADVLTFYQERIAQESYLRTATERVSLQEMGRLIGYRLRPGVAAETWLAFALETPPTPPATLAPEPGAFVHGVPPALTLAAGLKVQSVPGPDEKPQVFETAEAIDARPQWNAMRPWLSEATRPGRHDTVAYLSGVRDNLKPGDAVVFLGDEYIGNADNNNWDFRILDSVELQPQFDRTRIGWRRGLGSLVPYTNPAQNPQVWVLRRRASAFGHNAPVWRSMGADYRTDYVAAFGGSATGSEWPRFTLDRRATGSSSLLTGELRAPLIEKRVLAGRVMAAPGPQAAGAAVPAAPKRILGDSIFDDLDELQAQIEGPGAEIITAPQASTPAGGGRVDLDTLYNEVTPGGYAVLAKGSFNYPNEPSPAGTYVELYKVSSVAEVSRAEYALSAKVTRLQLRGQNYDTFVTEVRGTSVFAQSEKLTLAAYPVNTDVAGDQIPLATSPQGLEAGRKLIVRGQRKSDGATVVHQATLVQASASANGCVLTIKPPLPAALKRDTVVVHANVALASHGETVAQVLGAGDASRAFQRFDLKQAPLTWRAASNELGAASALTVRVDDVAWSVRDTMYGSTPTERAFTLDLDEQGRQWVQFGDGVQGARLPSGTNNVRASYRKGLGVAGNVAAESLTQPMSRPLGLKSVTNPSNALGGNDPESADTARATIPLRTRTLGRAVSLLDYEDFARAYTGVAKAQAAVLPLRAGPTVCITIAGPDNTLLTPANPVWQHLLDALKTSGDPHVRVQLLSHQKSTFRIGLKVKHDGDHDIATVLAAVEAALRTHFAFARRELAQPVQQSDVIAVAHSVSGVAAIDLDHLFGGTLPVAQTAALTKQVRLLASAMRVVGGAPIGAELLTLDAAPFVRLEEMS